MSSHGDSDDGADDSADDTRDDTRANTPDAEQLQYPIDQYFRQVKCSRWGIKDYLEHHSSAPTEYDEKMLGYHKSLLRIQTEAGWGQEQRDRARKLFSRFVEVCFLFSPLCRDMSR